MCNYSILFPQNFDNKYFFDDLGKTSSESSREFKTENKWYDTEGWEIIGELVYNQAMSMFSDDKVCAYYIIGILDS